MRYVINISDAVNAKLVERAHATGAPADEYIEQVLQSALAKPTLREILAPVHQDVESSAMTEGELDSTLTEALQQSRRERRAQRGA